jgi:hypothetical protein
MSYGHIGVCGGHRPRDLRLGKPTLWLAELHTHIFLAEGGGIEPRTDVPSVFKTDCRPFSGTPHVELAERAGIEPARAVTLGLGLANRHVAALSPLQFCSTPAEI